MRQACGLRLCGRCLLLDENWVIMSVARFSVDSFRPPLWHEEGWAVVQHAPAIVTAPADPDDTTVAVDARDDVARAPAQAAA